MPLLLRTLIHLAPHQTGAGTSALEVEPRTKEDKDNTPGAKNIKADLQHRVPKLWRAAAQINKTIEKVFNSVNRTAQSLLLDSLT